MSFFLENYLKSSIICDILTKKKIETYAKELQSKIDKHLN